ncbi:J domain-containing protein [Stagnihabitans tardus]|uniref:J domain-containing protein n=1 Tax=Stagnihabitans tardus TaxID=2699202 RepID=A0AAE4YCZ0_9RHOB|nr:J domain-containing protein [Stagnihabitans tardus]NBZ89156.1 hypothetical protein [Stagnihabitans tardus]
MSGDGPFAALGLEPGASRADIRRAYARRLKSIDPDRDPQAFQDLRLAYEWALRVEAQGAEPVMPEPKAAAPQATADETQTAIRALRQRINGTGNHALRLMEVLARPELVDPSVAAAVEVDIYLFLIGHISVDGQGLPGFDAEAGSDLEPAALRHLITLLDQRFGWLSDMVRMQSWPDYDRFLMAAGFLNAPAPPPMAKERRFTVSPMIVLFLAFILLKVIVAYQPPARSLSPEAVLRLETERIRTSAARDSDFLYGTEPLPAADTQAEFFLATRALSVEPLTQTVLARLRRVAQDLDGPGTDAHTLAALSDRDAHVAGMMLAARYRMSHWMHYRDKRAGSFDHGPGGLSWTRGRVDDLTGEAYALAAAPPGPGESLVVLPRGFVEMVLARAGQRKALIEGALALPPGGLQAGQRLYLIAEPVMAGDSWNPANEALLAGDTLRGDRWPLRLATLGASPCARWEWSGTSFTALAGCD